MKTTEKVLNELGQFMFDNGVTFQTSDNKIIVSIYRKHGLSDEYVFSEDVTDSKIEKLAYTKLN